MNNKENRYFSYSLCWNSNFLILCYIHSEFARNLLLNERDIYRDIYLTRYIYIFSIFRPRDSWVNGDKNRKKRETTIDQGGQGTNRSIENRTVKSRGPISLLLVQVYARREYLSRNTRVVRWELSRVIDRTGTDNRKIYIDRSNDWSRSIQLSRRSRGLAGARARRVAMVTNVAPPWHAAAQRATHSLVLDRTLSELMFR